MKKLLILGLLLFGGYKLHTTGHLPFLKKAGAFDARGNPVVRLFVGPGCGTVCDEIESLLQSRRVEYELFDISSPEGSKFGVNRYPLIQVGHDSALGGKWEIIGALARNLGPEVLSRAERMAMENHFDESGKAMVVMYGTTWCPHCKRQREYFRDNDIPYTELDPEQSPAARTSYNILQGQGYPLTYVGYQRFVGYKAQEIKAAWSARRG